MVAGARDKVNALVEKQKLKPPEGGINMGGKDVPLDESDLLGSEV